MISYGKLKRFLFLAYTDHDWENVQVSGINILVGDPHPTSKTVITRRFCLFQRALQSWIPVSIQLMGIVNGLRWLKARKSHKAYSRWEL